MDAAARVACAAFRSVVFSVGGLIQAWRQNGRLWRSANEAFGMSPMSFEKDLAPSGGELFGATIVNVGRRHEADS